MSFHSERKSKEDFAFPRWRTEMKLDLDSDLRFEGGGGSKSDRIVTQGKREKPGRMFVY